MSDEKEENVIGEIKLVETATGLRIEINGDRARMREMGLIPFGGPRRRRHRRQAQERGGATDDGQKDHGRHRSRRHHKRPGLLGHPHLRRRLRRRFLRRHFWQADPGAFEPRFGDWPFGSWDDEAENGPVVHT